MSFLNPTILRLSTQALLGRRRGLVLMLIPGLLIVLAVVVRALTEAGVGYDIVSEVGYTLALPIVALLAASAVLGPEIDDGSIVYLIAKPVPRHVVAAQQVRRRLARHARRSARSPCSLAGLVLDSSDPGRAVAWGVAAPSPGRRTRPCSWPGRADPPRGRGRAAVRAPVGGAPRRPAVRHPVAGDRAVGHAGGVGGQRRPRRPGDGPDLRALRRPAVTAGSVWFAGDRLRSFTLRGDE